MPILIREQENTISDLNWFLTLNGVKTDGYLVEYRILDLTQGLPGTQVFPATGWEDVTSAPGKFATGSYYAYDNTNTQGYTPPATASIGTHRIEWRWKRFVTSSYQSLSEDFTILMAAGDTIDTYITVQDIRDEGILEADHDDDKVLSYIKTWQVVLERACRQWFNERSLTLELDGNESDLLLLGIPIIEIEYIRINGQTTNLDSSYYKVYNNKGGYPDDRRNPKIKLVNSVSRNIFAFRNASSTKLIFEKGQKNQIIKGTFGFVESNGATPDPIKRALTKLVIEKLTAPIYSPTGVTAPPIVGAVIEEWTDGHKIKYGVAGGETTKKTYGLSGITSDPEILDIIKMYRAPRAINAAAGVNLF